MSDIPNPNQLDPAQGTEPATQPATAQTEAAKPEVPRTRKAAVPQSVDDAAELVECVVISLPGREPGQITWQRPHDAEEGARLGYWEIVVPAVDA